MIVENRLDWAIRNSLVETLIYEKRRKIKELELEIFTLNFTLTYWKQHPLKDK